VVRKAADGGPAFNYQRIEGAQHRRLAPHITKHRQAPAGFVAIHSSQIGGVGDKGRYFPT
jgi:hypothetical protein